LRARLLPPPRSRESQRGGPPSRGASKCDFTKDSPPPRSPAENTRSAIATAQIKMKVAAGQTAQTGRVLSENSNGRIFTEARSRREGTNATPARQILQSQEVDADAQPLGFILECRVGNRVGTSEWSKEKGLEISF
jgi:hypothetical protein